MLLVIVEPDKSIDMTKIRTLSQCIATDFEEPGICLDLFVICWPRLQVRASDCAEYYSDEICDHGLLILYREQALFF